MRMSAPLPPRIMNPHMQRYGRPDIKPFYAQQLKFSNKIQQNSVTIGLKIKLLVPACLNFARKLQWKQSFTGVDVAKYFLRFLRRNLYSYVIKAIQGPNWE